MAAKNSLRCKVPGCKRLHHAQGYCQTCYDTIRKKKSSQKMKSHSSDKKHAKSDNHKSNHKSAPKDHKDHKEKDHKAEHKGDHKADKHADKHAAKPHPEAEKQGKGMKKEKGKALAVAGAVPAGVHVATEKPSRLALIKQRHEAMKREIDQIREDLESDEDE